MSKNITVLAERIITAYNAEAYLSTFKRENNIPEGTPFNNYARNYYLFLLKKTVPEHLRETVDTKIQELRPELKKIINNLLDEVNQKVIVITEEEREKVYEDDPYWKQERAQRGYYD